MPLLFLGLGDPNGHLMFFLFLKISKRFGLDENVSTEKVTFDFSGLRPFTDFFAFLKVKKENKISKKYRSDTPRPGVRHC
jgi:hypothetical protein